MKALGYVLAAAAFALSAQAASAASLGVIEYAKWSNSNSPWNTDLGGAHPSLADAWIDRNDYNGAHFLPGGLPLNYSIHLDRTYIGDAVAATADTIDDRYWFKLDPAGMGGATSANADATLTLVVGFDTGMENVRFALYETNEFGNPTGGPFASISGGGNLVVNGLVPGEVYAMLVTGFLKTDNPQVAGDQSTNVGRYDVVLGLDGISAVPVPPALILLLTGIGALFGFGGMRKESKTA